MLSVLQLYNQIRLYFLLKKMREAFAASHIFSTTRGP